MTAHSGENDARLMGDVAGYAIHLDGDRYMGLFDTQEDARLTARAYGNAPVVAVRVDGSVVTIR